VHNRGILTKKLGLELGIGVGIGIGIERKRMTFGHEKLLDRIVAILTKLGERGYSVGEATAKYVTDRVDSDSDGDSDPERNQITV
jgi:TctA family transporter